MAASGMNEEDIAVTRKRLRYRAWHRGTQEMDLVLGHFADAHLKDYDRPALERLEKLMDESDPDLLRWVMGQEPPPAHIDQDLLQQLTDFQRNRAK